ncbi:MAG: hypothetical protein IJN02_10585 [Bacteroidales bacterium]|nr:hypothetical protein [Bacteroidales bacterium]MBQ6689660.1 hypothetical protein [Bacteroidales bacterium]
MQKIRNGEIGVEISVPEDRIPDSVENDEVLIDSIRGTLSDGPIIMNAIKDSETGEMVATDVIRASKVTARFRNVAERAGYVSIGFDVTVPAAMSSSEWQLKMMPVMRIQEDTMLLEPIYITGEGYRAAQMRGYQRYRAFLATIITDTTDFIRIGQLEVFLKRHFPDTYAMKTDSAFVTRPMDENLFGVTQLEALRHYTKQMKWKHNEKRKGRASMMYSRYVKDPIVTEGVRLDTVLTSSDGDFVYRYIHTFKSRPYLKKVTVSLGGSLYEKGERIVDLPFPEELTFYISSLSTLADFTPRYRMYVLERRVFDNTKAFIDFRQGSAVIDTLLSDNASELSRVKKCMEDVVARSEYGLDSLVIVASCSPEGSFQLNRRLSEARSISVKKHVERYVPVIWRDSLKASCLPENWEQLQKLVANDTVMSAKAKRMIVSMIEDMDDPDEVERRLSRMPEYRYMREYLYPKLRSVRFDFYLHRLGMVKDTVHTTELDTLYMSGVEALKNLDYKRAVTVLRPYKDYNSALAFTSADYNHSALDVLSKLDDKDSRVCYLMAIVLSRLEQYEEAMKYFDLCLAYDPYMEHRANLDPEMSVLLRKRLKNNKSYE